MLNTRTEQTLTFKNKQKTNNKGGEQTISPSPLGNTGGALKTFLPIGVIYSFWSKFGMNDQIQPNLSSDVQIILSSKPSVVIIFDSSSTKSIGNAKPFTAAGEIFGFYAGNDQERAQTYLLSGDFLHISPLTLGPN